MLALPLRHDLLNSLHTTVVYKRFLGRIFSGCCKRVTTPIVYLSSKMIPCHSVLEGIPPCRGLTLSPPPFSALASFSSFFSAAGDRHYQTQTRMYLFLPEAQHRWINADNHPSPSSPKAPWTEDVQRSSTLSSLGTLWDFEGLYSGELVPLKLVLMIWFPFTLPVAPQS